MVLSERVAWVEFMEMARAALFNQADDADAGMQADAARRGKGGVDDEGKEGAARGGTNGGGDGSNAGAINFDAVLVDRSNTHNSYNDSSNGAGEDSAEKKTTTRHLQQQRSTQPAVAAAVAGAAVTICPLTIGRSVRESSATDAWTVFRFYIPVPGPVLTVVLDALDGDPELFVSRGRVPAAVGAQEDVGMEASMGDGGGGGVSTPGHGGGDWQASSRKRGTLRVVKIFPHDPE